MSHRIAAYTLFDITPTGVLNRSRPPENDIDEWMLKRNTQCNFDTLLQVISLRSQPEVVKNPVKLDLNDPANTNFGFLYDDADHALTHYWRFEFEIHHSSVFENGIIPLGALYKDCDGVPMILTPHQLHKMSSMLDVSDELRNVYFEVI